MKPFDEAVRLLPSSEAESVVRWATQLAELGGGGQIEWSDAWSDDDLAEATAASLRRLEDEERDRH